MAWLIRILSFTGFFAYLGLVLFMFRGGDPDQAKLGPVLFFVGLPLAYLMFCFVTSFWHMRGKRLFVSGIAAHVAVLPFFIFTFFVPALALVGLLGLGMTACWFSMYSKFKPKLSKQA